MSYWLWRILLVCCVLGAIQWGYAHPDSQMSQFAAKAYEDVSAEFGRLGHLLRDFFKDGLTVTER